MLITNISHTVHTNPADPVHSDPDLRTPDSAYRPDSSRTGNYAFALPDTGCNHTRNGTGAAMVNGIGDAMVNGIGDAKVSGSGVGTVSDTDSAKATVGGPDRHLCHTSACAGARAIPARRYPSGASSPRRLRWPYLHVRSRASYLLPSWRNTCKLSLPSSRRPEA